MYFDLPDFFSFQHMEFVPRDPSLHLLPDGEDSCVLPLWDFLGQSPLFSESFSDLPLWFEMVWQSTSACCDDQEMYEIWDVKQKVHMVGRVHWSSGDWGADLDACWVQNTMRPPHCIVGKWPWEKRRQHPDIRLKKGEALVMLTGLQPACAAIWPFSGPFLISEQLHSCNDTLK